MAIAMPVRGQIEEEEQMGEMARQAGPRGQRQTGKHTRGQASQTNQEATGTRTAMSGARSSRLSVQLLCGETHCL
jgi:hypothetical protein